LHTSPRFSAYRGASINITAIIMTVFLAGRSNSICPYHLSVVEARRRPSPK
jgi:hypothetical protein